MKKIKYTTLLLASLMLGGCSSSEDQIVVDAIPYKRLSTYDVNSPDPSIKFISQYYERTGKIFITDPEPSDYLFNFSSSYQSIVTIKKPEPEHVEKGIKMVNDLLLKHYQTEFIKKYFPRLLIIGDSLTTANTYGSFVNPADSYNGSYFLMFKVQDIDTMSVDQKRALSNKFTQAFWTNLFDTKEFIKIPAAFFESGLPYYEKYFYTSDWMVGVPWKPENRDLAMKKAYSLGFVNCSITYRKDRDGNILQISTVRIYNQTFDVRDWIIFLINTPDVQLQELLTKYPALKNKYDILVKALTDAGLNYRSWQYTE